jgi:DNA-binding GntR family transcriptional regulator
MVVADATEQEMVDIYELRAILDGASVRLACDRITDGELARLAAIVAETERATDAGELPGIVEGHAAFHQVLYAASGNAELIRVTRNLWDRSYRFRVMALQDAENARHGLAEHRAILAALQARDRARAAALAEEHNRSSIRHLRGRIQTDHVHPASPRTGERTH